MERWSVAMGVYLALKRWTFPGADVGIRDRLRLARYFRGGDLLTLDAGCGNGAFSFAAYWLGNRVVGISVDEEGIERCRQYARYVEVPEDRVQFLVRNVYEADKLGGMFDQIICFETLEHLLRDADAVATLAGILAPGGILHLCTPYRGRRPMFGEYVSETENGGHVRLGYTHEELEELARKAGLEPIARDTAGGYGLMRAAEIHRWLQSRFTVRLPKLARDGVHMLLFWMLSPLRFLDRLVEYPPISVYIMARKGT